MKLWLDDIRNPKHHEDWEDAVWVNTPEEAIEYLETGKVTHLSLDNDLGLFEDDEGRPRDGYAVAKWLERRVYEDDSFVPPNVLNAHTANSVAHRKMWACFKAIRLEVARRG